MGKLFDQTKTQAALQSAWHQIRSNGYQSELLETRQGIEAFETRSDKNIRSIQCCLRDGTFVFEPQKAVTKKKKSGGVRGIVMASVYNRVVERALLNTLQQHVPYVHTILKTPTSIGGIPDRGVPHGLVQIINAFDQGYQYFVRSDISGFFDGIPRKQVLQNLSIHIDDDRFMSLLDQATTVTLANEHALGEDRKAFPTDAEGVAQGSPLSPLIGNILLHSFDVQFNGRGIICIRFIDDFLILAKKSDHARKAFESAKVHLAGLNLQCHDPFAQNASRVKSEYGEVTRGFVFLGYDIRPGLRQPSEKARSEFLRKLDRHFAEGRRQIAEVLRTENSADMRQRYAQTLALVDRVVRGWGNAFAYGNAPNTLDALDGQIDQKIARFRTWFRRRLEGVNEKARRRAGGVVLLTDLKPKSLSELPFRLENSKRYRRTKNTITVSTDGSVIGSKRRGRDKGPGGWAAVFHDGDSLVGKEQNTTNNRMELTAVLKALAHVPNGSNITIRTDSQYVQQIAESQKMVSSNQDLWEQFQHLRASRQVKIVWLRGHKGDPHNEQADMLANAQAKIALQERTITNLSAPRCSVENYSLSTNDHNAN